MRQSVFVSMFMDPISRRAFLGTLAATALPVKAAEAFRFRYLVASCLYGTMKLEEILPELGKQHAQHLDLWPRPHGDQREQAAVLGDEAFAALLAKHGVKLRCSTRYDLGPFKLDEEMRWLKRLGGDLVVTGGKGPKGLRGNELKAAVKQFVEAMKPHCALAEELGVRIAIENHGNGLMESPDSIRWLVEFTLSPALGIALAPYHLPQDESVLAQLIRECGRRLLVFYAWQHGKGATQAQPKADELLQMPGRGSLDFQPLVGALHEIGFTGWTSIFMHPFPRGGPIVEGGATAVTAEVNRARAYLERSI
jgi:sugar phosphate isomerase/epimerase